MPDINWGGDAAGAPFTSRLDDENENLILAETDAGTALFEWDGSAWQFRGPVEMNGEDVSGIDSFTATSGDFDSVNTGELNNREATLTTDDTGQYRAIGFYHILPGTEPSTTSTEFVEIGGSDDQPRFASLTNNTAENTNVEGDLYAAISAQARADPGTLRVAESPGTEISGEGFEALNGPIGEYSGSSGVLRAEFKADTDGGTFAVRAPTVTLFERIQ